MMNGSLALQASQCLAEKIHKDESTSRSVLVTYAFQNILHRNPEDRELASSKQFLETRSLVELCLVLYNTNEFIFVE